MRRWPILIVCSLASLPSVAQVPDPGIMALAVPQAPPPVIHQGDGSKATPPPALVATPSAVQPPEVVPDDGGLRDTLNSASARPVPDVVEKPPAFIERVEYLRKHHDDILAIDYLRQVITVGEIRPQYRARAIVELADCLAAQHQEAESLCWLKIWMQLYPMRPEIGAVAYRIGSLYTQLGLPNLARDAYYLALAHAVNAGQVQSDEDLKRYTRLTTGTLWALAANEYQGGQWKRAADLFARYREEAQSASAISLEKAAYLQADCYYQLRQTEQATSLYEETLKAHPFNPLAPEARLRLYHLYIVKKAPDKAREELQALAWTVRTAFPQEETYWQKQTAELLLAINQKNASVLPPLVQESSHLAPEGKTWQEALNHYDALVGYQAVTTQAIMDSNVNSSGKAEVRHGLLEEDDLLAMNRHMNQLLPPPRTASIQ